MRKTVITLVMMLLTCTAFGQSKLDLELSRKANQAAEARVRTGSASTVQTVKVTATLAKGAQVPQTELTALGIKVCHSAYGIVDMLVPVTSLTALDSIDEFSGYESPHPNSHMDYTSRMVEHVDSLQDQAMAKEQNLPSTYDGRGIIVGVFDSGIDFNHANFRDPDTKETRIKRVLIYRNYSSDKGPFAKDSYNYDVDSIIEKYDSAQVDTLTTDSPEEEHGSHVAGIAAGSYNGIIVSPTTGKQMYQYQRGTAYKADLILAGARGPDEEFQRRSLEEMAHYADSVKQPLVVNISIGSNCNWMDGKMSINTFFDNFTDNGNAPGRIVCLSAGNEGTEDFTITKTLDSSNDYTVRGVLYRNDYAANCIDSKVYFFCSDTTEIEAAVDMYNVNNGKLELVDGVDEDFLKSRGWLTKNWNKTHDNRYYGQVTFKVEKPLAQIGDKQFAIRLKSRYNHPCSLRMFQTKSDKALNHLPFLHFDQDGISGGDGISSFNANACTNSVLSVGSWSAAGRWQDMNDTTRTTSLVTSQFPIGDISGFSSYTPADDNGVARPDFCAPGVAVVSGFNAYHPAYFNEQYGAAVLGVAEEESGRQDKKQSYFGIESGTSMSSPNAAGIIALWLQANPQLSVNDIRKVIRETADYTGIPAEHRIRSGAGKINALAGLKYILKNYPSDIQDITDGHLQSLSDPAVRKVLRNGRLIIIKGGKQYSIVGQEVRDD